MNLIYTNSHLLHRQSLGLGGHVPLDELVIQLSTLPVAPSSMEHHEARNDEKAKCRALRHG